MRRPLACAVSLILVATIVGSAGLGDAIAETDGNDVAGALDLRRLTADKDGDAAPLVVTIRTWRAWEPSVLRADGPNRMTVRFDVDLDGSADYSGRISRSDGALQITISGSGASLEPLPATRPNKRSVRFTVPGGSPANPNGSLQVAARSRYGTGASCDPPCRDRIPDAGWVAVLPSGGGSFACTQVIGFSQTKQWYLGAPDFEEVVGTDGWQLLWKAGGGVQLWADPDFAGWDEPIQSPCETSATSPDRVVFTVSDRIFESDTDAWVDRILAAIATIRTKVPGLEQIVLQPVVGGPNGEECEVGGETVRASFNHPFIDEAIARVVGGDVVTGASPEVRTCADYRDSTGHLENDARGPIGLSIGDFYA